MHEGIVKYFNNEKGYGFIKPDNKTDDVFFHISQLGGGYRSIEKGERVSFYISEGLRGPTATGVIPINGGKMYESRLRQDGSKIFLTCWYHPKLKNWDDSIARALNKHKLKTGQCQVFCYPMKQETLEDD